MSESAAGEAAFLGSEEIINNARTVAYLKAGYGPPNLQISGVACTCPNLQDLIECDASPYSSPAADPAPWYDSSIPESADFGGFYVTEFTGLGSTYSRNNVDKITGGAVLGRLQPKSRTLTWRGFLFGRSDCAVQYGLRWMTANLRGANCLCGGEELDILICCPDIVETNTCTELPALAVPDPCPPFDVPDAFRNLKNVGLIDGPKILSQRRVGCGGGCGNVSCGDSVILEIEFSLLAGNPFLYGCPVCLCVDETFPVADCPEWNVLTQAEVDAIRAGGDNPCADEECPADTDCTTVDNGCLAATLPDIPVFKDKCFCDPLVPVEFCCTIPSTAFSQFFEGAPVIEIYSGSAPMRATTIRFFSNPQGLSCCDVAANPCLECDSLQIRYIPKQSTLTIDGTTRTVTVQCPGMGAPILADNLTVTPFAWPILQCGDFCICVETDEISIANDATVSISIVPREM
jgi:hypothetical protein